MSEPKQEQQLSRESEVSIAALNLARQLIIPLVEKSSLTKMLETGPMLDEEGKPVKGEDGKTREIPIGAIRVVRLAGALAAEWGQMALNVMGPEEEASTILTPDTNIATPELTIEPNT